MARPSGFALAAALLCAAPAAAQQMPDMPPMSPMSPPGGGRSMAEFMSSGVLGDYPMSREASGTSWQPDASPHEGLHIMSGPWMVMIHATLNGVYDSQQGPRGGEKAFASGMLMAMAKRDLGESDTLQLRAMLSPDALMGRDGFPELLQTGETANGVTPLIDRQHPHDLFMELSATLTHRFSSHDSVFVYAGLPGEPAFGPPAFMHRLSTLDSPEVPITHHWLDSTHISEGVVTAGVVHGTWKVEASRFRGREPDEHRFDIETGPLDSTAVRISYNPTREWALQASWADVASPEELRPEENARKWSASAIYTRALGPDRWWSTTAAWGRRSSEHGGLDGFDLESAVKPAAGWTVFARAERLATDELTLLPAGPVFTVGKVSVGAVRDFAIAAHWSLGVGALYAVNFVPDALKAAYGGSEPAGAMGFMRLKLH